MILIGIMGLDYIVCPRDGRGDKEEEREIDRGKD